MHEATVKHYMKALYTTTKPNAEHHQGVMVVDHKRAVTHQHGLHSLLKKDQNVILYNVMDPTLEVEVVVIFVSEQYDYVVFKKLSGEFPHYPQIFNGMHVGQKYRVLSVGQNREPVWEDGVISERHCFDYFGCTHEEPGCAIFDLYGTFIGISIARQHVDLSNLHISVPSTSASASEVPKTKLLTSIAFYCGSQIIDSDDDDSQPT